jgi:hypothetical protein
MLQYLLWWFRGVAISSGLLLWCNWWLVKLSAALYAQLCVVHPSKGTPRARGQAVVSVSGGRQPEAFNAPAHRLGPCRKYLVRFQRLCVPFLW